MRARLPVLHAAAAVAVIVLFTSCSSMREASYASGARGSVADVAPAVQASAPRSAAPSAAAKSAPAAAIEGSVVPSERAATGAVTDTASTGTPSRPGSQPAERKRVYQANLELLVASIDTARSAIIAEASDSGGYVESSTADTVVIRVPAAAFDKTLERTAALGQVRSRSVEATDVTDQFADLSLRLSTTNASRDRLYQLLEQTGDADERLAILREIRRLTEQIEQLKSSLATLDKLIQYSRITVHLASRIAAQQIDRSAIPFPWIANLDPLRQTTGALSSSVNVLIPIDFALFSSTGLIRAEAADGTRIRIGSVRNNPDGDTEFWATALPFHLNRYYAHSEPVSAGAFRGTQFRSRDANPFVYVVLVKVDGPDIVVAEFYFPSSDIAQQRLGDLESMLEGATS